MTWKPLHVPFAEQPPITLRASLERMAAKIGAATPTTMSLVFDSWDSTVGDSIAGHAQPVSLVDGILTIEVDDLRWANELRWMSSDIVARLNDKAAEQAVSRIDITVGKGLSHRK